MPGTQPALLCILTSASLPIPGSPPAPWLPLAFPRWQEGGWGKAKALPPTEAVFHEHTPLYLAASASLQPRLAAKEAGE